MPDNASIKELAAQIMPCDMSKPYAFVSYSKQDYARVYPCIIALQQSGCNIWVDKNMEAQADHSWTELAFEAIQNKNCVAVIFMISANSLISVPCFNEVLYSQKGQLTLNRHRNNPVKLITVNADSNWNPRRTHFSQWVYDESDKYNDDSAHNLSIADSTLLDDLGDLIEPRKRFNIPTRGDIATAFMNDVYGGAKEIDRSTVLPYDSIAAILKNISETMDKPIQEPAPGPKPEPVTEPPSGRVQAAEPESAPAPQSAPVQTAASAAGAVQAAGPLSPSAGKTMVMPEFFSNKRNIIIAAAGGAAVVVVALVMILVNALGVKNVTDKAYALPIGDAAYTVTYTGEWQGGKPNGEGTAVFGDNVYNYAEFEGTWENGYPKTGRMTETKETNHVYEGDFVNGKYEGQGIETRYDENGRVTQTREGEFKDGEENGQFTATYYEENGNVTAVVKGEFKDGRANGLMKYTRYDEDGVVTWEYEGGYVDGARSGQGKETGYYENSEKVEYTYEGEYADGKWNGKGKWTSYDENGFITSIFEGDYVDDSLNGQVKETSYYENSEKAEYTYEGEYANNYWNGKGKKTNYDENGNITSTYEGNYVNDMLVRGVQAGYDEEGNVAYTYDGEFKDGKRSGQGTYTWADGYVYVGEFADGVRNGQGKLMDKNGTVVNEGEWKDDKFVSGNSSGGSASQNNTDSNAASVRNLRVYASDASTARIEWHRSLAYNDTTVRAKNFEVEVYEDSAHTKGAGTWSGSGTYTTISNAEKGKTYYCRVRASFDNENGEEVTTDWQDVNFTFTGDTSVLPGDTQARVYTHKETAYMVEWAKVADATGYQLAFFSDSNADSEPGETWVYDAEKFSQGILENTKGKTLHIGVRAVKTVDGLDIYSEWKRLDFIFTGEVATLPEAPKNFTAAVSPDDSKNSVWTWDAVDGATGYHFRSFTDAEFKTATGTNAYPIGTTIILGPMVDGHTYYYGIRAIKTVDGMDTYSDWTYLTYTHNAS